MTGEFAAGGVLSRPCGARRPPVRDAGWECNGAGLIVVSTLGPKPDSLPIVLPRRALEIIEPEPWWDLPVKDFAGGDHAHLCVPRRPPSFRGDNNSVLLFGSSAMPFRMLGEVVDGVQFLSPFMQQREDPQ